MAIRPYARSMNPDMDVTKEREGHLRLTARLTEQLRVLHAEGDSVEAAHRADPTRLEEDEATRETLNDAGLLEGILDGLTDIDAGRLIPLDEALRELRGRG
jgi:predicted transcriptional regulator